MLSDDDEDPEYVCKYRAGATVKNSGSILKMTKTLAEKFNKKELLFLLVLIRIQLASPVMVRMKR
jgi:hypothetical protein